MTYPVHRVLREGGDEPEFNRRLEDLKQSDLERLKKIESICARLEYAELIKYGSNFVPDREIGRSLDLEYQNSRVVTYLCATTLDVISQEQFEKGFATFPDWFLSHLKDPEPPDEVSSLIKALETRDGTSVADVVHREFIEIKRAYLNEAGMKRRIRRLLKECLDPWLQEWLGDVFVVAKNVSFKDTTPPVSFEWRELSSEQKLEYQIDYLVFLRNQYTHTTKHLDPQEFGPFRSPKRERRSFSVRWTEVTNDIYDKVQFFVGLRSDLSESEIIRMLAVHIMRKWLGYQDSEDFVKMYFSRVNFRYLAYALYRELEANLAMIGGWATIESKITRVSRFDLPRLLLRSGAASEMVDVDFSWSRYRDYAKGRSAEYLDLISYLNDKVEVAFREAEELDDLGWRGESLIRNRLQELASAPEGISFIRKAGELRQSLDQTLSVPFY